METVRCGNCNKKLAEAENGAQLNIKCPRCGTLNHVTAPSRSSERRGASLPETHHVTRENPAL
ncbi:MAG: Com family DNA-binding transcriptional regulator [Azoarcus sp.]|jgi:phage FluMu protein Com|nr:Com family DNA-binding transcriptional regulator [Azoarcus sp.]